MMSPIVYLAVLAGCLAAGLILGLPMSFTLGVSSIIGILVYGGPGMLGYVATQVYSGMRDSSLLAMPLFIFIACVLERSGIADATYEALHQWTGPLRGGLAIATVLACTIIAAISGVAAAGVATMGVIALPLMLKRGYDKSICLGPIMAGGALGILIPPSVVFILYGMMTRTSIGRLFAGGLIPGLILAGFYMIYIGVRCFFQPELGPALPPEERVSLKEKIALTKGLILPILLIFSILGSIFFGIASPMESAAVGALGAIVCTAINRRLSWTLVKEACYRTLLINSMVMWIVFGAKCFSCVFISLGASKMLAAWLSGLQISPIYLVFVMQSTYLLLGCIVDEVTMLCLTVPVYAPILAVLGFDPVWFGVLFMINMQIGYLTPPFGYCLFYMKGVAPPGITMVDIYRSIGPMIGLAFLVLLLVMFFPQIALWLPNAVFKLM